MDEAIALVISILNKKGYKTAYSCSGHIFKDKLDVTLIEGSIEIDGKLITVAEGEEYTFSTFTPNNDCYIAFDGQYNFPVLPDGFTVETENNMTRLGKEHVNELTTEKLECARHS